MINQRLFSKGNSQGFTLIESLVAIVVVGVSVAMVGPLIAISVGARVQSQKAEQAFQIAQGEIDRLRLIVERGDRSSIAAINNLIPAAPAGVVSVPDFETLVPPPEDVDATNFKTDLNFAKPVDDRFAVQLFRNSTTTTTSGVNLEVGVRVYASTALDKPAADLGTVPARLGFTSGQGNSEINPLAVVYTTLIKSDADTSLCDYYSYIDSVTRNTTPTNKPGACPP